MESEYLKAIHESQLREKVLREVRDKFDETRYFYPDALKYGLEIDCFNMSFKDIPRYLNIHDGNQNEVYWKLLCEARLRHGA